MVEWAEEHFPQTDGRILDGTFCFTIAPSKRAHASYWRRSERFGPSNIPRCACASHDSPELITVLLSRDETVGTGNGQLLFAFSAAGYTSLTGIDYSPLSIQLANDILAARAVPESEHTLSDPPPCFFVADILQVALGKEVGGVTGQQWDLITDKGTYDAVCLSDEQREGKSLQALYVESIARLLPKGGIFLITSCGSHVSRVCVNWEAMSDSSIAGNWTQAELEKAFVSDATGASRALIASDKPISSQLVSKQSM